MVLVSFGNSDITSEEIIYVVFSGKERKRIMKCPKCGSEQNGDFCNNCGTPLKKQGDEKSSEKKLKKKLKKWQIALIVVAVIVVLAAIGGGGEDQGANTGANDQTTAQNTEDNQNETEENVSEPEPEKEEEPITEHFETDLTAGNYVAGVDIPAGTYNLTATSGSGNVSSSNMYNGGLNEIMGSPADEYSQETFNNLQLPAGETLSLGGTVTLHIVSEDAQTSNVKARTVGSETQTDLSAGNYTAGTDFPAGVYNIVCTGGMGNVNSDNMYNGGLNEVMGDGSDEFSVHQVNNVSLPEGTVLTISGTSVQLVPVGE